MIKVSTVRFQAERERREARYVIEIQGERIYYTENPAGRLTVIAVIGPVEMFGTTEQAVLLEIGMRRMRPYQSAYGTKEGPYHITPRIRCGALSLDMFREIFPYIEEALIDHTSQTLSGWKRNTHVVGGRFRLKGVRFSVSLEDHFTVASILQSERHFRQVPLERDLEQCALWIQRYLKPYTRDFNDCPELFWKYREERASMNWAIQLLERRKFLPHHFFLLFQYMQGTDEEELFRAIMERYRPIDSEEVHRWGKFLSMDVPLLSGTHHIWTVPPDTEKRKHSCLVFEMISTRIVDTVNEKNMVPF